MPGKTMGDRVDDLRQLFSDLQTQDRTQNKTFDHLLSAIERLDGQLAPIYRDWSKTLDRLDKLEKAGDQWSARLWDFAKLVLAAAVGGVVAYLVKR